MKISLNMKTPLYFLEPLFVSLGVAGLFLVMCSGLILGAFLWPYTINTWLVFFDKAPQVVWWQGVLLTLFPPTAQLLLPLTVITWVVFLFLT